MHGVSVYQVRRVCVHAGLAKKPKMSILEILVFHFAELQMCVIAPDRRASVNG